jgi:hypothetical protein
MWPSSLAICRQIIQVAAKLLATVLLDVLVYYWKPIGQRKTDHELSCKSELLWINL